MKRKITITLLSCAALAAFTPSLRAATTLLDNTSAGISSGNAIGWDSGTIAGIAFSTGSTAYNLGSIQFATDKNATGNLTLSLYQGDASSKKPTGLALASQTFSYLANGAGVVMGNLTGFSLSANSNYVLALATDVSDGRLWVANPDTTFDPGTSGLTYLGREFSLNGGSSWGGPFTNATPWMKLTDTAVTAVPEPSAFVLLGLGAIGLVARRRRVG